MFSPNKKRNPEIILEVGNEQIKQVNSTKFLGVWIDNKLKWNIHLDKLYIKLKCAIGMLSQGKNLLDTHTKKIIYYAQFFSHLNYCVGSWGPMIKNCELHKLESIQNKALRIIGIDTKAKCLSNQILSVQQVIWIENVKFAYKCLNALMPLPITMNAFSDQNGQSLTKVHQYNTRNKSKPNTVPAKTEKYRNSIIYSSFIEFNKLPMDIQKIEHLSTLINKCKDYSFI